jgi:undecaprenyl-diphosphatase
MEAQVFFVALLAVIFLARGKWRSVNGRHGVVAAGFSALLALGAAQIIAHIWERPRPYIAHPGDAHLFIAASHDPSFPSDHATAAFAIAVALLLRHRKAGILAIVMAVTLCVARVAVGTHYPGDVLGGALLGSAAALVLWHPVVRRPLHDLGDWVGRVYETILFRSFRRPLATIAAARAPRVAPAVHVHAHLDDLVVVVRHELVAPARPPGAGARRSASPRRRP